MPEVDAGTRPGRPGPADPARLVQGGDHLGRHLTEDVLTWWMAHGRDREHGGVLSCWDNAGTTLAATDKYTWSQGRWAWLTARVALAAEAGVLPVDAGPYAETSLATARFLRDHALLPDGTTAFVTSRVGIPWEPEPGAGLHTSVFADLFAALGFAGAARLEPGWGRWALDLLLGSAAAVRAGTARSEPYPVAAGHRSFGLPMILVGVGEQVFRATGAGEAAAVVAEAAGWIERDFLRGDDIVEMPRTDGGDDGSLLVRHRTPGHVLEALWFLHHARDLIGVTGLADAARLVPVAVHALELGWDDEHGGLLRYVDAAGGRPAGTGGPDRYGDLVRATWDTKLWWPHAEALYATRLLTTLTGDPVIAGWADRVADYTVATFPEGSGREWTQIRDRRGRPLEQTVALPVKDPFHVARALLLSVELDHAGETGSSGRPAAEEEG